MICVLLHCPPSFSSVNARFCREEEEEEGSSLLVSLGAAVQCTPATFAGRGKRSALELDRRLSGKSGPERGNAINTRLGLRASRSLSVLIPSLSVSLSSSSSSSSLSLSLSLSIGPLPRESVESRVRESTGERALCTITHGRLGSQQRPCWPDAPVSLIH